MVVIDCVYDKTTGGCSRCGMHMSRPECPRNCRAGFREHPADRGVGTELHKILSRMGISETSACKCKSRVALLNQWGPQHCAENIETIVGWLKQEAGKRGLPFLKPFGHLLVKRAIHNAKKASED